MPVGGRHGCAVPIDPHLTRRIAKRWVVGGLRTPTGTVGAPALPVIVAILVMDVVVRRRHPGNVVAVIGRYQQARGLIDRYAGRIVAAYVDGAPPGAIRCAHAAVDGAVVVAAERPALPDRQQPPRAV